MLPYFEELFAVVDKDNELPRDRVSRIRILLIIQHRRKFLNISDSELRINTFHSIQTFNKVMTLNTRVEIEEGSVRELILKCG